MLQFQKLNDGCRTTGDLSFDYFNRSLQINTQRCGISNFGETKNKTSEMFKILFGNGIEQECAAVISTCKMVQLSLLTKKREEYGF